MNIVHTSVRLEAVDFGAPQLRDSSLAGRPVLVTGTVAGEGEWRSTKEN